MKPFELNNQPKIATGFKVPENYFDDFSKRMQTKILEEEPAQKVFFLQTKNWIYTAAAVLIIGFSIAFFNNETTVVTTPDVVAIDNYISNEASISEDEMIGFLDIKDIKKMSLESDIKTQDIEDELLNTTDLEQNLID
jgi:hypothetical protein